MIDLCINMLDQQRLPESPLRRHHEIIRLASYAARRGGGPESPLRRHHEIIRLASYAARRGGGPESPLRRHHEIIRLASYAARRGGGPESPLRRHHEIIRQLFRLLVVRSERPYIGDGLRDLIGKDPAYPQTLYNSLRSGSGTGMCYPCSRILGASFMAPVCLSAFSAGIV